MEPILVLVLEQTGITFKWSRSSLKKRGPLGELESATHSLEKLRRDPQYSA